MMWSFASCRKVLRRYEPLFPGLLVSGVVVALSSLGTFKYLDYPASDVITRWRGPQPWSEELLVIDIDDATVTQLRQYPLSRKYYADLLQKLIEADNRVVAFDILMSEPNQGDELLAGAMAEHGGTILATTLDKNEQALDPVLSLRKNAREIGQIDDSHDFDGITRRHRLSIANSLSLAASTAAIYSATAAPIALPKLPNNELLINWPGPVEDVSKSLAHASLVDILDDKIPAERIQNKIILVGVSARGVDRDIRTPFDSDPVDGMYVYAAVLHNLLQENWLRLPNQPLIHIFLLLMGPLITLSLQGRSFLRQMSLWIVGVSLWLGVCFGARFLNYALPVATPIVLLSLTEGLIIFTDRLRSSAILQARNEFLGTMSHELRTPLNAIIGVSEMMQETHLDPRQREFSETIQNSSQALLALINDVLDFSKIEAGRLVLEEHPVNLRNSVEESLDIVSTRAANKPLDLVYMVDPKTPPVIISDPIRLRQILLNLLSNAVKFTEKGEVAVIVQPAPSDDFGTPVTRWTHPSEQSILLLFAVRDTGIGIPEDRIAQIFEPFRQASTSTTRKYGGTGLGLTISKRLAETMGGRLWVESTLNQGSSFFFTIRVQVDPVTAQPERPEALKTWANQRMLVIDKNSTRRTGLGWQLEALDMEPIFTRSVAEALLLVQQGQQFDGVILDAAITKIDSMSAIESLRQAMGKPTMPLIVLADIQENFSQDERSDMAIVWKPIKQAALYRALMHIHPQAVPSPATLSPDTISDDERSAPSLKVLIADDNPVNQRVAQHMLQLLGHQADTVATGGDAIAAVEQGGYDVVLMDMRMPQMSGVEATRRIRQLGPNIPQPWIIAMTANASSEDRDRCLKVGMNDYVSKPIRRDSLSRMFQNIENPSESLT
ncbi:CHASE2 domain-containing protein [Leptothoe spongobia]|uniref:Circadian input-output histidine kinase CikA n=1 Tax=Leptothoe spongobia TAU-MAC 1115 TaxID=1967444 RepID=A0A947DIT5_9CYAN|nr:CHASE2 domain-containing protein [Leptothoe spongobia]MBT9317069.1 CHASE2 domain-containing protein [Leptothoe spongobia TAU-MAC 1115]